MKRVLMILLAIALMTVSFAQAEETPEREVHEPTCTESGYTKIFNADGSITIEEGEPPLGHDFGEWQTDETTGDQYRICTRCGRIELEKSQIAALPRIDLDGSFEGMSKQDRVTLKFSYRDEGEAFDCYAFTSWQGHSTLTEAQKNYTVRLYADEGLTDKNRMELRPGWQVEHKYVLKANYGDMSLCRNLSSAAIWARMAESRKGVPERLKRTSHYGAVDGFPVQVYHDGAFLGLYTMNLHKDDDLYALRYGTKEAIVICNRTGTKAGLFREEAAFNTENWEEGDWEIEYCGTEGDTDWVKESFNGLIHFVMTADDASFREQLGEYLDVNSAIDYLIFLYAMGLTESADRDLTLIRYEDTPWIATVYDMESAYGLARDGSRATGAETFLPEKGADGWTTNTGSLLWDRLMNNFTEKIIARYRELRGDVLTEKSVAAEACSIMDAVPERLREEDYALYPDRERISGEREQILDYIHERLPLLDKALTDDMVPEGK